MICIEYLKITCTLLKKYQKFGAYELGFQVIKNIINLMFFGEELLGGRQSSIKKSSSTQKFTLRPRSLQRPSVKNFKNGEMQFPTVFENELQIKSLDTIKKEYNTNPFFKVKLDLLLRQFSKNGYQMGIMKNNAEHGTQTLRGQTIKSSHVNNLRLLEIKEMLDKEKKKL